MEYYITKQKLKELEKEHQAIKENLKKELSENSPNLLEGGDLNPDFTSYEEDLMEKNSRLEEIEAILSNHKIINKPPASERNKVHLGAHVVLSNNHQKEEYRIVGTLEANPFEGKISNESPVGKAFIGKNIGDTVSIGPNNLMYQILAINYEDA